MAQLDEFGEELADFRTRVGELAQARSLPPDKRLSVLDAALIELQHVADTLWPGFERLAAGRAAVPAAERQELQLLKALFQRHPLPVALVDRETVVRRINFAATGLTGVRAGYATGRPFAGVLTPGDRAAFRSQAAAVARGEGDRSLVVHLQQQPHVPLRATLTAVRPPGEPHMAVLVVLQAGTPGAAPSTVPAGGRLTPGPDLAEATRHAELMDLVDAMAAALLRAAAGGREAVLHRAAGVLHRRFADWVVADAGSGPPVRTAVLGPADDAAIPVLRSLNGQDPADCPLVVEAARGGSAALQVRPEDPDAFGSDASGASLLVRAEVTSLLCVPLTVPADTGAAGPGPVQGVLTLFRTGSRRAFSMAEGQAMDMMSRHIALAMRRPS
ncbi:PAS domain-containing protein [Streptomyces sp. NPDC051219]|uniref:PAS domain-containing protein n=1 Tax=Streptomyces sp. NPDC051219 TaxID=3155283 RepID=UPI00341C5673